MLRELGTKKKGIIYLTKLINTSFRLKHVPLPWKLANIMMLLKPGKKDDVVSSYRPISLLSLMAKIFERVVLSRINYLIAEQKLLPDAQFGFRAKHCTAEQAHRIVTQINHALEDREFSPAVYLDVSRAFDPCVARWTVAQIIDDSHLHSQSWALVN